MLVPRSVTGLSAGSHRVRARDAAGNVDASPATRTWTADTTSPNTTLASGGPPFSFSSSESNSTFECSLDGAAFASCTAPKSYTGLAVGSHEFRVRAKDAAGNVDASPAAHTWTVTRQVLSMYATANNGFLVRDATENGGGIDQVFHSREKGTDNPPRLVVTFG